ncbi:MAG: peptide-methionine (S)-S-oxide reductase MsrA [Endomicrobiales bacterium]
MEEKATFAMGCFWGVQMYFDRINGVVRTRVGYAGGNTENPTYDDLDRHAETIEITFDPSVISYRQLLDHFWAQHDPTARQKSQYRSAIFTHGAGQQDTALASREEEKGKYKKEVLTEIRPAPAFYPAEEYHQKYYLKKEVAAV